MKIKFKRMYDDVTLPAFASSGAACFDIRCYGVTEPVTMNPGDTVILNTGLQVEIPEGYVLMIYSRSGHGFRFNISLSNGTGVIDSDYRGEIMVALHRDISAVGPSLTILNGDRVAQGMLVKLPKQEIVEVDELTSTERGEGGFGSTGTN